MVAFLFFACVPSFAHDIILKKAGDSIFCKVLEVGLLELKYKKQQNLEGPDYVILKSQVIKVVYANGSIDSFNEAPKQATATAVSSVPLTIKGDPYLEGIQDADRNYKGYKAAGTGTLVVSRLSPIIGLIPAIASSSTAPQQNLDVPNEKFMQNAEYSKGYKKEAKQIKQGKVWKNWGIGLGVNLIIALLVVSS